MSSTSEFDKWMKKTVTKMREIAAENKLKGRSTWKTKGELINGLIDNRVMCPEDGGDDGAEGGDADAGDLDLEREESVKREQQDTAVSPVLPPITTGRTASGTPTSTTNNSPRKPTLKNSFAAFSGGRSASFEAKPPIKPEPDLQDQGNTRSKGGEEEGMTVDGGNNARDEQLGASATQQEIPQKIDEGEERKEPGQREISPSSALKSEHGRIDGKLPNTEDVNIKEEPVAQQTGKDDAKVAVDGKDVEAPEKKTSSNADGPQTTGNSGKHEDEEDSKTEQEDGNKAAEKKPPADRPDNLSPNQPGPSSSIATPQSSADRTSMPLSTTQGATPSPQQQSSTDLEASAAQPPKTESSPAPPPQAPEEKASSTAAAQPPNKAPDEPAPPPQAPEEKASSTAQPHNKALDEQPPPPQSPGKKASSTAQPHNKALDEPASAQRSSDAPPSLSSPKPGPPLAVPNSTLSSTTTTAPPAGPTPVITQALFNAFKEWKVLKNVNNLEGLLCDKSKAREGLEKAKKWVASQLVRADKDFDHNKSKAKYAPNEDRVKYFEGKMKFAEKEKTEFGHIQDQIALEIDNFK